MMLRNVDSKRCEKYPAIMMNLCMETDWDSDPSD
jgi:hypothetical protein